jgi:hypothetical protein
MTSRRTERRVGDAERNDATHAGGFRGADERARVFNGAFEGHRAVREAHPVGVDEHVASGEGRGEFRGLSKRYGGHANLPDKRVARGGMIGERADFMSARDEKRRQILARVGEGASDGDFERRRRSYAETFYILGSAPIALPSAELT